MQTATPLPPRPSSIKIALLAIAIGPPIIVGVDYAKKALAPEATSKQAQSIIGQLRPIADILSQAERTGDIAAAVELALPLSDYVTKLQNDEAIQKDIQQTPTLRYCELAAKHLLGGAIAVANNGDWTNKDKFENALTACQ